MKTPRRFTKARRICPKCNGSGLVESNGTLKVCKGCNGTGVQQ